MKKQTLRDSRVSEHLDTKSVVDSTSSSRHASVILAKRRSPRRANNPYTAGRMPPIPLSSRDPVSLGEVEGVFRAPSPLLRATNARSSRRGKEQIRSNTSKEIAVRQSDLRAGDNPWNGARESWSFVGPRHSKSKRTIL
jgi:hypothetical protein